MGNDSVTVTFEIHTLKADRWMITNIDMSEEEAVLQAKEMYALENLDAVKVIRESYDPDTNEARERTIYSAKRGGPEDNTSIAQSIKLRKKDGTLGTKSASTKPSASHDDEDDDWSFLTSKWFIFLLIAVVLLGIGLRWYVEKYNVSLEFNL